MFDRARLRNQSRFFIALIPSVALHARPNTAILSADLVEVSFEYRCCQSSLLIRFLSKTDGQLRPPCTGDRAIQTNLLNLTKDYMRKVFHWLWTNSEALSHWATVFAFLAAGIGGILAYGQLKTANAQLEQANDQKRWQNYNEMNVRYADLYENLPKEIASGCSGNFEKLRPETKRWVRQYFHLYSEEYWLYLNELIPKEMWTRRIHGGVRVNLSQYPALVDGYYYWKAAGSFTHPDSFQSEVGNAIEDAKRLPKIAKPFSCKPANSIFDSSPESGSPTVTLPNSTAA